MANELQTFQETNELCSVLLSMPHYQKLGREGIYSIVETAKSLGVDPRMALNGGMYCVKGKVEMSARMMNALIRSRKHSITKDDSSDDSICILHGRRADTGDTWTESFSMAEAQKAGLTGSPSWRNWPRDMLFARALSRLARQLFPDVIGNVYVEGEISMDPSVSFQTIPDESIIDMDRISDETWENLDTYLNGHQDLRAALQKLCKVKNLRDIKEWQLPSVRAFAQTHMEKLKNANT
jgi:hypothetical protein